VPRFWSAPRRTFTPPFTFGEDEDYSEYSSNTGSVCVLKVALAYSKEIWRKIAIREGQTLHDLHNVIFEVFDRYDEHVYSFFLPHSAKKLNPRNIYKSSDEYTHPYACEDQGAFGSDAQNASTVSIESLDLTEGQVFYYLFDFGDEWWHEITVEKTDEAADKGKYPRTIKKEGESPEQYPDSDEEDDW
jgi:Plasmid pRiA4b ORF-3-like protein